MTEAEVRKSGRPALIATMPMEDVSRAFEKGETSGFMKILVDKETKQFLGASLFGLNGDEIVHTMLDQMYAKAPYTVMARAMHIHPTVTSCCRPCCRSCGSWSDTLPRRGNAQLVAARVGMHHSPQSKREHAMASPFRLDNKVAIITGSSRGIGRAIAEHCAALGAKVVISSRKADACEEVAAGIKKNGGDATVIPCNISRKHGGRGAGCRHREAIWRRSTSWSATPRSIRITARSPASATSSSTRSWRRTSRAICGSAISRFPHMVARGGGSVIIISSIGGIRGTEVLGAYGISKAADFALARNLACEWGPKNVRVNCVAPGLVKTDFARALWENEEMVKRRNAATPLRRIGMPDEIGGVAAFLAGPGGELHHRAR